MRRNDPALRVAEQAALRIPTLLIREVDITSRAAAVDPQGRRITQAGLASQFGVRVVPVVAMFDERLQLPGDPLVGIDRSGSYDAYRVRAVEMAQRRRCS